MKNKSIMFVCLFFIFSGLLFSQEKVVLKVFALPDPKDTGIYNRADMAVIKAFKEKYPNIELRKFSGIQLENMSLDSAPLLAIAGGVSPDVIYVNFRQSSTYIENDFLYPLDEYVNKESKKDLELRVAKPIWPVIQRKKSKEDSEHIWALPYETLVRVLMYRKDLFYKVGLDPNRPPKDWDELVTYAKKLTIPSEGTYGLILASGPQAAWDWITYLWSAGGNAVKLNPETNEWYASFNGQPAVDAMNLYLSLITTKWKNDKGNEQEGFVIREGNWGGLWDDGKVGMRMDYMSQRSLGGKLDPNLYGVAPPPFGPTGLRSSEINCRMMGIFSGAGKSNNGGMKERNPQKVRDAAWKYIQFYDSETARKIRMKVMIEAGYGRMQNPIYLKRYGYDEYLKYIPKNWIETFEEAMESGHPEPYGHNCQKIYEFMTYPIEKIISMQENNQLGDSKEKDEKIRDIFDNAVKRTNIKMLDKIPPKVAKFRLRIATLVAFFISIAFIIVIYKVWNIFSAKEKYSSTKKWESKYFWAYLMLVPAVGSIILWKYVPMLMGSVMAFQDYHIVGPSSWVGFQNFATVLFDPVWWSALGKTFYYMLLSLTLGFVPPILLAIVLQEVSHGKIFYRIIYYLPSVVSGVIVIYLWKLLYDPSDAGGLNQILLWLGLEKSRWLQNENLAMLLVVVPTIWAGIGPGCLIYLAALKGIPDDIYEAADLDGANFFHKLRYIVYPKLKALITIQFIAAFIAAAQQSEFILVMTFGGPNEATQVADLMIFQKAYLYLKFGIATTMAWMLSILLMGFTVYQIRKISNMEFRSNN